MPHTDPEQRRVRARAYRLAHLVMVRAKEALRHSGPKYRAAERARSRLRRLAHPERHRTYRRSRRARLLGAFGSFTEDQWLESGAAVGWRCLYCSAQLDRKSAVREHRVPLARGGSNSIENIAVSCLGCNSRKGARTDVEFLARIVA